jgi:hypothetical protein
MIGLSVAFGLEQAGPAGAGWPEMKQPNGSDAYAWRIN